MVHEPNTYAPVAPKAMMKQCEIKSHTRENDQSRNSKCKKYEAVMEHCDFINKQFIQFKIIYSLPFYD